jgi:transketolase
MTGVAAGLASEGYHVFTYSIANFPTVRCLEQIRNDVCYHRLPVTVVAVGGGLAYGSLGYSHHAVQDYAMMRSLPEMKIVAPGDPLETQSCMDWICRERGPTYLRLGKAGEPILHSEIPKIQEGEIVSVIKHEGAGVKNLILSTGATLGLAVDAAKCLQLKGQYWEVGTMPLWAESSKNLVAQSVLQYDKIIALEDHLEGGGFGSFLREAVGNNAMMQSRLQSLALNASVCGMVGSQKLLNHLGGLSVENIQKIAAQ